MQKKRVVSGMQTTGKLHLGNLVGALENWNRLQDQFECYYFAADWHALSSNYGEVSELQNNLIDLVINLLSAGIDPDKSTIFAQSQVREHAILHIYFSMIIPIPWLERVPSYKEKLENVQNKELTTYGFLGYPLLQAADILLYKADFVPVGIDQLPHIELTREVSRRFHDIYSCKIFLEPEGKLSTTPKLPGIDGRKMSKSYDNAIFLSDEIDTIKTKVGNILTDPARVRKSDPGDPDKCVAFEFHKIFSSDTELQATTEECTQATRGCVDCKKILAENILTKIGPLLDKRHYFASRKQEVIDIIFEGSVRARKIAKLTLEQVEEATNFNLKKLLK
ncbi:MAG: tryptophan--tRNA ligase [Nitrospinota bacterium]